MLGGRYFGFPGAMAALAGMIAIPLVIVLLLTAVYGQFSNQPAVIGALRGMGAVAAGLIIASGLKLSGSQKSNPLGIPLCVFLGGVSFVGVALLRWPLVFVLLGLGSLACIVAYRNLKP
jgi:chromate transporter